MLNSLLKRISKKIKIDRVMKVVGKEKVLLKEEKDVQNEVRLHFMKQFRKRITNQDSTTTRWIKAYSPIKKLDKNIYDSLLNTITEEK